MGLMDGQVALVTGGAGGIGLATAHRFLDEGAAQVVIFDIDEEAGAKAEEELTGVGSVRFVPLDMTDDVAVADSFARVGSEHGRIDALFNCAGGSSSDDAPVAVLKLSVLRRTLELNLVSAVAASRAAIPFLRQSQSGSIVNTSSWLAVRGCFSSDSYAMAKAGVSALTRSLAGPLSRQGIRVNAVAPALIRTPRAEVRISTPGYQTEGSAFSWDAYPLATGQPSDVAGVVAFLCSKDSRMIVGQTLMIDGGITAFF